MLLLEMFNASIVELYSPDIEDDNTLFIFKILVCKLAVGTLNQVSKAKPVS